MGDQPEESCAHEDTNIEFLLQCLVDKRDKHVALELLALPGTRIRTLSERQQAIGLVGC